MQDILGEVGDLGHRVRVDTLDQDAGGVAPFRGDHLMQDKRTRAPDALDSRARPVPCSNPGSTILAPPENLGCSDGLAGI